MTIHKPDPDREAIIACAATLLRASYVDALADAMNEAEIDAWRAIAIHAREAGDRLTAWKTAAIRVVTESVVQAVHGADTAMTLGDRSRARAVSAALSDIKSKLLALPFGDQPAKGAAR